MGCAGCTQIGGSKKDTSENIIKRVHTSSISKSISKKGCLDYKNVQRILRASIAGDIKTIRQLVEKFEIKEVVAIRGLQILKDDIFELHLFNTQMWNPLHFSIFMGHYEIVNYFVEELRVNPNLTLMKPLADSDLEEDIMGEQFKEDKIFSLIMAYDQKHLEILNFLLNYLASCMPKNAIKHLIGIYRNRDGNISSTKWDLAISVILQSRSAHSFFYSLTLQQRKDFIFNTLNDINDDRLYAIFEDEFSRQPYSSILQFYLIYEAKTANSEILSRAMRNSSHQDIRAYILNDEQLLNDEIDYQYISQVKEQIVEDDVEKLIDDFFELVIELREEVQVSIIQKGEDFLQAVATGNHEKMQEILKESDDSAKSLDLINIRATQEFLDQNPDLVSKTLVEIKDEQYVGNPIDWTPIHFAILNSDLQALQFLLQKFSVSIKSKTFTLSGFGMPQETQEILPLILSAKSDNFNLFKYYWITLGFLWNDSHIESIMKFLSSMCLIDYMKLVLQTRTAISIFESLPFRYRFKFIENLIPNIESIRDELLENIRSKILPEQLDTNKEWNEIWDFDDQIIASFSQRPYSIYYFVFLTEYQIPNNWQESDLQRLYSNMQQAYLNVNEDDYFLYCRYNAAGAKEIISSAEQLRAPENMKEQLGKNFGMKLKKYYKIECKGDLMQEQSMEEGMNERQRAYLDNQV